MRPPRVDCTAMPQRPRATFKRQSVRVMARMLALALAVLVAACDVGQRPWAPGVTAASPGNASATLAFQAPLYAGQSAISTYVATCTGAGETWSARGEASPLTVPGLANGHTYACTVSASNAAGMGAPSGAVKVTPRPDPARSLAAVYRQAAWGKDVAITFPDACTMTIWPSARPSHPVDAYYLTTTFTQPAAVASPARFTQVSAMPLAVTPLSGPGAQAPMQINICPSLAPAATAVNAGGIGVMISGSVLFGAAEIAGHRATTLQDNVAHTFTSPEGETVTAQFIDHCNGHPTPADAGNSYHYHGLSDCVTSLVDDSPGGPSHLIGVALDGFPIYGDRDIHGQPVPPQRLDACNGITSPTPEFPQGVYHYVLPSGIKAHNASMRCYSGHISRQTLATADASGFCYAPRTQDPNDAAGRMVMGGVGERK